MKLELEEIKLNENHLHILANLRNAKNPTY